MTIEQKLDAAFANTKRAIQRARRMGLDTDKPGGAFEWYLGAHEAGDFVRWSYR